MVYPVYGGMEDWIYAGGWDSAGVQSGCRGLPTGQRVAQPQAAVFLVETSDLKAPPGPELGCVEGVLANSNGHLPLLPPVAYGVSFNSRDEPLPRGNPSCDGHVQRNIRLTLSAIDLVQPYACTSSMEVVEARRAALRGADGRRHGSLRVAWYVGGGRNVNATWVSVHHSPLGERANVDVRYDAVVIAQGHYDLKIYVYEERRRMMMFYIFGAMVAQTGHICWSYYLSRR